MKSKKSKLFRISLFGYNKKDVNDFIIKLDKAKTENSEKQKEEKENKEASEYDVS